jgi:hypothetical protein
MTLRHITHHMQFSVGTVTSDAETTRRFENLLSTGMAISGISNGRMDQALGGEDRQTSAKSRSEERT